MATRVRSFSKINLGLAIGPVRDDGFHALTTMYQTLDLHDVVTVSAVRAAETQLTLTTNHQYVPTDGRNTAWKMLERCLGRLGVAAEVAIHIEKRLPVQGGLGAGSANAAAALLGLERELGMALEGVSRLEVAAEVGSDVPLFLVGGAVLGLGRGEQVTPLPDLPVLACVVAVPALGVSTPQAFRDWDARVADAHLTAGDISATLGRLSLAYTAMSAKTGVWPNGSEVRSGPSSDLMSVSTTSTSSRDLEKQQGTSEQHQSMAHRELAEHSLAELANLIRCGGSTGTDPDHVQSLHNDFEDVVFRQYPSLLATQRQLMGAETVEPALYAALSGSGSALFGLYRSMAAAKAAQHRVQAAGTRALITTTLPRAQYWRTMFAG